MHRITRRRLLGVAGVAGLAAAAPVLDAVAAQDASLGGLPPVEKDVVFGKGGATDLRCDLYRPRPGTEKRLATIHLHGGGFAGGSKETLVERVRPYAERGSLAVVPQYRLTGQAGWPAMIEDVKTAIRWTRANASRLGIDPARLVIVGYSAGGHLALTATGTQNDPGIEGTGGNAGAGTEVAACVAYYPVSEGGPPPSASPISLVTGSFAPTVIFHGVADTTVPLESSQRLFQRLRDVNVPSELHTFAGAPHVFDRDPALASACGHLADLFLGRHLKTT